MSLLLKADVLLQIVKLFYLLVNVKHVYKDIVNLMSFVLHTIVQFGIKFIVKVAYHFLH